MKYRKWKNKDQNIIYRLILEGEEDAYYKCLKVGNNRVRHGHYDSMHVWVDSDEDVEMSYYPN